MFTQNQSQYQPQLFFYSKLKPELCFDVNNAVISFVVTSKDICGGNFGHAAIFVEMLNPNGTKKIGFYHAKPDKDHKYVEQIGAAEENDYKPNYDYQAKLPLKYSQTVASTLAIAMINSIHQEKRNIENGTLIIPFKMIGVDSFLPHWLVNKEKGINCSNWVAQKLEIAGIGDGHEKKPSLCMML